MSNKTGNTKLDIYKRTQKEVAVSIAEEKIVTDKLIYDKIFELFERVVAMELLQGNMRKDNIKTVKQFRAWAVAVVILQVLNILVHAYFIS